MDSTCAASVSSSHMEFVSDGNPGNSERCEPRNNSLIGNYCQNAHFQTSESRLDVHTHFWFFHFCRLNREYSWVTLLALGGGGNRTAQSRRACGRARSKEGSVDRSRLFFAKSGDHPRRRGTRIRRKSPRSRSESSGGSQRFDIDSTSPSLSFTASSAKGRVGRDGESAASR